jgi:hypothetical protein
MRSLPRAHAHFCCDYNFLPPIMAWESGTAAVVSRCHSGQGLSPKITGERPMANEQQNPQRSQQQPNNPQQGGQQQGGQNKPGQQQGGQNKPGQQQGGQNKPDQGGQHGGDMKR